MGAWNRIMERRVKPELLDELPAHDLGAVGSRRDLQRLNAWMGNCGIMTRSLHSASNGHMPGRITELGAGDGRFLLRVARRLSEWKGARAMLLDRHDVISPKTRQAFEALGWDVEFLQADVLEWLRQPAIAACDAMIANLFLHHFSDAQLAQLLRRVAARISLFIAIEPRRSVWSLAFSRGLWLLGCNRVTRYDAPISVHAGFSGNDLSRLWPADDGWFLQERRAGAFSHLFVAQRNPRSPQGSRFP